MNYEESGIQKSMVKWFRFKYPKYKRLLFHVPNGGNRSKSEGARFKAEGVVPGVADLALMVPKFIEGIEPVNHTKIYCALFIEVKTAKGKQTDTQKAWQSDVTHQGYRYETARSLDEFIELIEDYLN